MLFCVMLCLFLSGGVFIGKKVLNLIIVVRFLIIVSEM